MKISIVTASPGGLHAAGTLATPAATADCYEGKMFNIQIGSDQS